MQGQVLDPMGTLMNGTPLDVDYGAQGQAKLTMGQGDEFAFRGTGMSPFPSYLLLWSYMFSGVLE